MLLSGMRAVGASIIRPLTCAGQRVHASFPTQAPHDHRGTRRGDDRGNLRVHGRGVRRRPRTLTTGDRESSTGLRLRVHRRAASRQTGMTTGRLRPKGASTGAHRRGGRFKVQQRRNKSRGMPHTGGMHRANAGGTSGGRGARRDAGSGRDRKRIRTRRHTGIASLVPVRGLVKGRVAFGFLSTRSTSFQLTEDTRGFRKPKRRKDFVLRFLEKGIVLT